MQKNSPLALTHMVREEAQPLTGANTDYDG